MSLFVKTLLKHCSNFHHIRENNGVDIGFFFLHRKEERKERNCDVTRNKLKKNPNKVGEIKLLYQKDFLPPGKETSLNTLITLSKEECFSTLQKLII